MRKGTRHNECRACASATGGSSASQRIRWRTHCGSPSRLPPAALAVVSAALLAGCAAAPSSSGLTSANPGNYAPPVFGSRTALSDPREQTRQRVEAPETRGRAADAKPPPSHREPPRIATARVLPEQPSAAPPARHESVDTGRRKALDATREADRAKPAAERPRAETPKTATRPPSPTADGNVIEVAPGDTLLKIATRYKVSVSALMSANRLASLNVETGQRLVIPKR